MGGKNKKNTQGNVDQSGWTATIAKKRAAVGGQQRGSNGGGGTPPVAGNAAFYDGLCATDGDGKQWKCGSSDCGFSGNLFHRLLCLRCGRSASTFQKTQQKAAKLAKDRQQRQSSQQPGGGWG